MKYKNARFVYGTLFTAVTFLFTICNSHIHSSSLNRVILRDTYLDPMKLEAFIEYEHLGVLSSRFALPLECLTIKIGLDASKLLRDILSTGARGKMHSKNA